MKGVSDPSRVSVSQLELYEWWMLRECQTAARWVCHCQTLCQCRLGLCGEWMDLDSVRFQQGISVSVSVSTRSVWICRKCHTPTGQVYQCQYLLELYDRLLDMDRASEPYRVLLLVCQCQYQLEPGGYVGSVMPQQDQCQCQYQLELYEWWMLMECQTPAR